MIEQKNNAPSLRPAESDPAIIELNTSDSGRAVLGITHAGRTAIESVGVILEPPEDCDEPKPGYVLIEGSIETLNEEAGAVWELMDLAHKNSDADTQEKIEQFEEEYAAACTVAVAKGKEIPPLADALSTDDNLPEDYKTLWLAYDALETKIEDAEKELDNHASEKAADVKQKALALEKNVNYDEVVTRVFDDKRIVGNHPALRTVTAIISARKLIENGNPLTYTQLKVIEHKIDESAAQCTEEGLLRSSDVPVDEVDTLPSIKQAAGIGERITDLLNIRLKYKYPDQTVIANGQAVLDTI